MSDDQLGKLFRELPDEDPPDTGMAALMAAARAKAAEMAPPPRKSLWARFLDGIKAPPVLALATVVVLIGGAVIIKNHDATMDASNQVDLSAEAGAMRAAPPPPAPPPVASAPAIVAEKEAAPAPAPVAPPAPVVVPPPKPPVAHVAQQQQHKPMEAKRTGGLADIGRDDDQREMGAGAVAEEAPAPAPPPPTTTTPTYAQPPKQPSTAPPPAMTIASDDVAANTAKATSAQGTLVEKLLHACQAAAQKRDCPTAKSLAGQIHDKDVEFYRARVLKDADIVKCL